MRYLRLRGSQSRGQPHPLLPNATQFAQNLWYWFAIDVAHSSPFVLFPLQSRFRIEKYSIANRLQIEIGCCPNKAVHFKTQGWLGLWRSQSLWTASLIASKCNAVWTTLAVLICDRLLLLVCQRWSFEPFVPLPFQSRHHVYKNSMPNWLQIKVRCCQSNAVHFKAGW